MLCTEVGESKDLGDYNCGIQCFERKGEDEKKGNKVSAWGIVSNFQAKGILYILLEMSFCWGNKHLNILFLFMVAMCICSCVIVYQLRG